MTIAGLIVEKKQIVTKKGDRMAFATIEDLSGKIEVIFFPKVYNECFEYLEGDDPIVVNGYVRLSDDRRSFYANSVKRIEDESDDKVKAVRISVDVSQLNDFSMPKLKQVLLSYRGSVPAHFIFETAEGKAKMELGNNYLVNPTPQMAAKINELLNNNSVQFIVDGRLEQAVQ